VVTLSSDSRPILGRGPSLGIRFTFFVGLSLMLMYLDRRTPYLESARDWLSTGLNPFYSVVQAPLDWWSWMSGSVADRADLREENARLEREVRNLRVRLLQYESLSEENRRLRAIRAAAQGTPGRTLIAEIMQVSLEPFRHRVRINQGSESGVFKGQPVLDAFGIVGQVARVDRYGAEVILISDPEHATPVQVNRNGVRSIAEGTGDYRKLSLASLTVEADIKVDDLLVSSGLDDIFPRGYPVARVTKVERDPAAAFAIVEAKPLAQLDRAREVMLLWFERPGMEPQTGPTPGRSASEHVTPEQSRPGTASGKPQSTAPAAPAAVIPPRAQPSPTPPAAVQPPAPQTAAPQTSQNQTPQTP
jgi:rod shape-determining protein MreC